jgi:hypothetical protein
MAMSNLPLNMMKAELETNPEPESDESEDVKEETVYDILKAGAKDLNKRYVPF